MNMKYNYPTTMYESILAKMYVFLVFLHFTAFYHEKDFKQKLQKKYFSTRIVFIRVKILSYIVVK